jgi:hypothetical protein
MAKFQSPLLGYNNNVRHKGRVFHIQTEDSGVNHPHIITHLFMDGGRILKSVKTSYAEHVGNDNMSETVRVLMKEQHKAMFIALRDGQFDALFDEAKKVSTSSMVAPAPPAKPTTEAKPVEAKPVEAKPAEAKPAVVPKPAEAKPVVETKPAAEVARPSPPSPPKKEGLGLRPNQWGDPTHPQRSASPTLVQVSAAAALAATVPPMPPAPQAVSKAKADPEVDLPPNTISDERRPEVATSSESEFVFPDDSNEVLVVDIDVDDSRSNLAAAVEVAAESSTDPSIPFADVLAALEPAATVKDVDPPVAMGRRVDDQSNPNTAREPERRASAAELTLDFDALEREPSPSGGSPYYAGELPPPPKNLFAKEPRTSPYSATLAEEDARAAARVATSPPLSVENTRVDRIEREAPAPPTPRSPSNNKSAEGRYAPARPAAIFSASAPKEQAAPSIFSDELVSDKSLDEVILSYLAEDLDPPRRK